MGIFLDVTIYFFLSLNYESNFWMAEIREMR